MTRLVLAITLCCSVVVTHAQDGLPGTWHAGIDNTRIEKSNTNGSYAGTIISSDNPEARIGRVLLKDVKPGENGEWQGKLYSKRKDKWLNAKLIESEDVLLVTVKSGVMSKTLEWSRE